MPTPMRTLATGAAIGVVLGAAAVALAQQASEPKSKAPAPPLRAYVPTSVSPEAAAILKAHPPGARPPIPNALTFGAFHAAAELAMRANVDAAVKSLGVTLTEREMGGVRTLEVLPRAYKDDGTVLIYVHGGGFVLGSARSSLGGSARMADITGKRVISVDYTVAPKGQWRLVTDQVIGVYKAVLAQGVPAAKIGMFGESAGASILSGTMLKIRDEGLPLPAALLLVSPATDLSGAGDTRVTLANADPVLWGPGIQPGIDAYAPPADQKNPYVSAVYGDFSKGYPPTLIIGGTKELLLSDMVRLERAIRDAGGDVRLELYEGMPHVFPGLVANAPEGKSALREMTSFWTQHLPSEKR
jgi:monoterpene epsilon-lactone hydrolase